MLDRLFDIIVAIWSALLPFKVVRPWEQGCLLRLGKFQRVLEPGFHWILPFHIDEVWDDAVVPRTHTFEGATTTKDGKAIGYTVVVTFQIADIEKATLKVHEVKDAINDTCMGIVGVALSDATWEDVLHGRTGDELTKQCRAKGWRWGIEIQAVQLAGASLVKNIRLSGMSGHEHTTIAHNVVG